jgi:thiol:disulfide interchange protein
MKLKPTRAELRSTLLVLLGIAITLLFIMAAGAFWKREYGLGSVFLAAGSLLTFAFFRKRKASLLMVGLVWVAVNAGVTAGVRPTIPGILVTVGSLAGIVMLARWMAGRPPTPLD